MSTVTIVRYWPLGKPVPRGWKFAGSFSNHHGQHSILIEKIRK